MFIFDFFEEKEKIVWLLSDSTGSLFASPRKKAFVSTLYAFKFLNNRAWI